MEDENINLAENTVKKQRGRPFEPGKSGNPKGKPAGTKNYITQLEEAIKDYEKKTGKQLFNRLIERAFVNDNVLLNVVKKFVPDKTQTEITSPEPIEIVIHRAKDEN
jgi:hypothetical protein